jgi:hypothetical protein
MLTGPLTCVHVPPEVQHRHGPLEVREAPLTHPPDGKSETMSLTWLMHSSMLTWM